MKRLLACAAGVIALTLLNAGCGGSSTSATITKTIKAYQMALAKGDGSKACSLLSGAAKRAMSRAGLDCVSAINSLTSRFGGDDLYRLTQAIKKESFHITVSGDVATAVGLNVPGGARDVVTLTNAGGRWYIVKIK